MRTTSFVRGGVLAIASLTLASVAATPAAAQASSSTRSAVSTLFDVTPYAGYMMFGNFLNGPLGTALTTAPAPVYGAQLGMKIAPNVSLIGNLAASSSDIQIGLPFIGGVNVAHSSMVLYDAGLQLDLPLASTSGLALSPFVQGGIGGMRYDITQSFVTTHATNLAGNIGAGVDVGVGRGVGLRLMAKDYIGKFDFQDATSFSINAETTNNVAVSAGLRFSF